VPPGERGKKEDKKGLLEAAGEILLLTERGRVGVNLHWKKEEKGIVKNRRKGEPTSLGNGGQRQEKHDGYTNYC